MSTFLNRYKLHFVEVAVILLALLFLIPFYFVLVNSFKSMPELLKNTASIPEIWRLANYQRAWDILNLPLAITNSLIITIVSTVGLTTIASMCAYRMVRKPSKFNNIIFSLFVAAMVIPIQAIMLPLVKILNLVGIINSIPGLVISYIGLGIAFSTFLFHGFVKSIPYEIEESAIIDGCSPYRVYWSIVFPLLKPMTVTVVLLNTLWFWNEFLLAQLILLKPDLRTIQLAINSLFSEYTKQWDLALAALVMSITPAIVFFFFLQRHIIEGVTAGAVKG
ncbi:carbohydrate ABC transporter permease [Paenibacillus fonticola]|uniref:carbohydrate ABC transporter permease n=1 Tax=Paenibacillus fonticola TaxID=379896 RepID=UPI00037EB1C5|nr:carbohydrate ABC transporter permease [Paenibacillus fonticola]